MLQGDFDRAKGNVRQRHRGQNREYRTDDWAPPSSTPQLAVTVSVAASDNKSESHLGRPLWLSEGTKEPQGVQGPRGLKLAGGTLNDDFGGSAQGVMEADSDKASKELPKATQEISGNAYAESSSPRLLAVAFHSMIDAQGSGFRAGEVWVTVNYAVSSHQMYEDLLQDCRLGRIYVQLSTALAYYTLFYWEDVEYHRFLPFPIDCVLEHGDSSRLLTRSSVATDAAAQSPLH